MLTKGIVEKVIDNYSAKIRIPIFNKSKDAIGATPLDELSEAIICTLPNSVLGLQVGDIVIVGFEDNNINKPIVLGYLSAKDITTSGADLQVNSLKVKLDTHLSEDTYIGEITPKELKALLNVKSNIQWQIDVINQQLDGIPDMSNVELITNKVTSLSSDSTDIEYPSAKCVYDIVGDIETLLAAL